MIEYRYDTQLLIEGVNLDEDAIAEYITNNFEGIAFSPSALNSSSKYISTQTNLGRYLNTAAR